MKIKSQSAQEGTARGENMDTNVFFRLGVVRRRAQGIVIRASLLAIAATVFTFATARCHASTEQNPTVADGIPAQMASETAVALPPADAPASLTETPQRRGWFRRMFFKPEWAQVLSECTTPRDVCKMVQRHVTYREEQADQWTAAEATWERGAGDCEDFAICVQKLCQDLGFEASVHVFYSLKPGTGGHAVVMGEWDGRTWMADNGAFERLDAPEDAVKRVARTLWCKPDQVWSVAVADADVAKMTATEPPAGIVAGPVAAANASI